MGPSSFYPAVFLLIGIWLGIGVAFAVLVWRRNKKEPTLWRVYASCMTLVIGPWLLRKFH